MDRRQTRILALTIGFGFAVLSAISLSGNSDKASLLAELRGKQPHLNKGSVPQLVEWLKNWDPYRQRNLVEKWLPRRFSEKLFGLRAGDQRYLVLRGFETLGDEAEDAVPELVRLANDPERGFVAIEALSLIGNRGIDALVGLAKSNQTLNAEVCLVFGNGIWTTNEAARQTIIDGLNSEDQTVRMICSNSIALHGDQSEPESQ